MRSTGITATKKKQSPQSSAGRVQFSDRGLFEFLRLLILLPFVVLLKTSDLRQATDEVIPTVHRKHPFNIQIVRATKRDIPTMWAWGEKHWELWNSKTCKWYSRVSLRRWLADPRHDVLLIAKERNKPVGMCVAHTIRDFAYCTGVYIEKEYRGNGIATKLVKKMITLLRKKGIKEIVLSVNRKNNCALSLFESFGFKKGYSTIPLYVRL